MAENRVDLYASPLVTGAPTVGQPVGTQYQWRRAVIVRHLGQSQYLVRLRYNNSIVNARIGWLEERIAKLLPEIAGRRQYLAVWLAVVRHYEQQVRNDLKLLIVIGSKEFRDQRKLVEAAEKAFRIGIPYSYAEFQGKRNEVGDLGDELIWAAEDAAELIPNDEGIRDIPLAAIEAFHTTLDNLTSASCWEFVPGDPCQDGSGGGGDPLDESPFLSGFGSGWPGESPPTVEESGESGDGTGGGNRKAEAIAAARDLLAAFPTVEQCMDRLRVSQKDLAEAGAWYAAAKADLAVWVFDLAETTGEKKLLTDRGVLADVEVPAWTMRYCPGLSAGLKVWVSWPCGDPTRGYPVLDTDEQSRGTDEDAGNARYGQCGGQPQSPMAMGLAGSVLAFALSPAWQRHHVPGPWPASVLSIDTETGTASVRLLEIKAADNVDLVVRNQEVIDDLALPGFAKAWKVGDIAALYKEVVAVDLRLVYTGRWYIRGWMERPKTCVTREYLTYVESGPMRSRRWVDDQNANQHISQLWWYVRLTGVLPSGYSEALTPSVSYTSHIFAPQRCTPVDLDRHPMPGDPGWGVGWDFFEWGSDTPGGGSNLYAMRLCFVVGTGYSYERVRINPDSEMQWLGTVHAHELLYPGLPWEGILRPWIEERERTTSYSHFAGPLWMAQGVNSMRYPPD